MNTWGDTWGISWGISWGAVTTRVRRILFGFDRRKKKKDEDKRLSPAMRAAMYAYGAGLIR